MHSLLHVLWAMERWIPTCVATPQVLDVRHRVSSSFSISSQEGMHLPYRTTVHLEQPAVKLTTLAPQHFAPNSHSRPTRPQLRLQGGLISVKDVL